MSLQSPFFDDFRGSPAILIWGKAADLRPLSAALRANSLGQITLSQWCKPIDGKEITLERVPQSSGMRSTGTGFEWKIGPEDSADFADKVDVLISSDQPGHQYLECGGDDSITVIISSHEYPEGFKTTSGPDDDTALSCTFCHKSNQEVLALLAFPDDVAICDECVLLMVEIIAADHPDWRNQLIEKLKNR